MGTVVVSWICHTTEHLMNIVKLYLLRPLFVLKRGQLVDSRIGGGVLDLLHYRTPCQYSEIVFLAAFICVKKQRNL